LSTFLKGQLNDRQLTSLHINVFLINNFGKSQKKFLCNYLGNNTFKFNVQK